MVKKTLKQRIVDASVVLFQQDGYHNVTVDRIVEYIGASKGGFYHNFKSKDELLYEIHDVFISYVIKQSQEAYDKYDTPITRLCAMLQTLTQVFDMYQAHITVFYEESHSLAEEYSEIIHKKRDQYRDILQKVIEEGQQTKDFRTELPCTIVTMAIVGMINWTYKWFKQSGPLTMEEITEVFTDMILRAIVTEQAMDEAVQFMVKGKPGVETGFINT
ncbi:TetR/AcrR family transcriptional regulator [Lysinibacillus xylanilyticus]|uniref:TetR/AcrR family transcriptional regulator n=1 Tax=Lysinibacillus xylanilyticus TaxID=582475 RepID=UPI002B2422C3|nr:TetR/AcrR family transcriptional regulator [Lysinibacillus xylanilyticus]MEB2302746.1 TetR/AcrR family transcriptional regulator [Lysinibacillus xylanilyticus]